jgi:hypothetical protein
MCSLFAYVQCDLKQKPPRATSTTTVTAGANNNQKENRKT